MSAGQLVVHAPQQRGRRDIRANVQVRHLRKRVHPGVGASGAVQLESRAPGRFAHRAVEFACHRAGVLLNLPPAVARAGVFDASA